MSIWASCGSPDYPTHGLPLRDDYGEIIDGEVMIDVATSWHDFIRLGISVKEGDKWTQDADVVLSVAEVETLVKLLNDVLDSDRRDGPLRLRPRS